MQSRWSTAHAQFVSNEKNDSELQKSWKDWLAFLYAPNRLWADCEVYLGSKSPRIRNHLADGMTSLFPIEATSKIEIRWSREIPTNKRFLLSFALISLPKHISSNHVISSPELHQPKLQLIFRMGTKVDSGKLDPQIGDFLNNQVLDFISVKEGKYWVGNNLHSTSSPIHQCVVGPFRISPYPVTQSLWVKMGLQNHSKYKGATRPVENISFYDAIQFCNRLSLYHDLLPYYSIQIAEEFEQKYTDSSKYILSDHIEDIILNTDANGYRLPFEQEWEVAVRGDISEEEMRALSRKRNSTIDLKEYFLNPKPKDGRHSLEDQLLDWNAYGWFSQKTGTRPVGLLEPIGDGLYDAIGNVFEWCYDAYVSYSSQIEEVQLRLRNQKISIMQKQHISTQAKDDLRIVRGGSWSLSQAFAHPSARFAQPSKRKSSSIGMRLVRNGS